MIASNGDSKPFDLNAARRVRAEVDGPPKVVLFGDREYSLPAVPPASVLVGLGVVQQGQLTGLREVLAGLFGEDNVDAVLAAGFDLNDLADLFGHLYGMDVGEQPASGISS